MFRTKSLFSGARICPNQLLRAFVAVVALCLLVDYGAAQDPTAPIPVGKGLRVPQTGELAQVAKIRANAGQLQPVEWIIPKGGIVEVATPNGFARDEKNDGLFALEVNSVYRFRVTNLEASPKAVLYPTLELLGRLNPPHGKAWEFPVEIYLPLEDIDAALNGSLITRVVFLENSENPANVDVSDNPDRLTLDVPRGVDPIVAARTRGRVLAIVRLGSREPSEEPNGADPFYFGLPRVEFKPPTSVGQDFELRSLLEAEEGANAETTADTEDGLAASGEKPDSVEEQVEVEGTFNAEATVETDEGLAVSGRDSESVEELVKSTEE